MQGRKKSATARGSAPQRNYVVLASTAIRHDPNYPVSHTYDALDDAIEQAEIFRRGNGPGEKVETSGSSGRYGIRRISGAQGLGPEIRATISGSALCGRVSPWALLRESTSKP